MFQRILLALDAGDTGDVATSFTVALARQCDAAVHVVHVNEYLLGGRGITSESPAEAADLVAGALRDMHAAGVRATGVTYRTTLFDVPAAICDLAEQVHADVIVMGSRRRRRPSFLRRSLRDRISRTTSLPVVTAPAPLRVDQRACTLPKTADPDISVRS
ncbi:MAG TPA: universal stress protein [Acidimicrobiales bacterium]|nr:universal stress protein [Acidimicrobiales bacterium]